MSDWEDFTEDVRASLSRYPQRGCAMGQLLAKLDASDAAHVQAALDRRELSSPAIHEALKRRVGADAPTPFTIRRHRAAICRCGGGVETK